MDACGESPARSRSGAQASPARGLRRAVQREHLQAREHVPRRATAAKEGQPQALTPAQLNELRATVKNLKPGHSRIFIHRELVAGAQPPPKELEALLQSVRLAQHGGANVNLTFWGQGTYAGKARLKGLKWPEPGLVDWPRQKEQQGKFKWPDELRQGQVSAGPAELMRRFANIIKLARAEGACITHATIQNEPNGVGTDIAVKGIPRLSMRMYEWLYRLLDKELRALDDPLNKAPTLRDAIKLVGGDLVLEGDSGQNAWLAYMRANMDAPRPQFPCVLDGYSIHVYWDPGDGLMGFPRKLEKRLENLPKTLRELGIDRPLYVTEYGVKKRGPPAGAGRARQRPSDRVLSRRRVPARLVQRPGAAVRVRRASPSGSSTAPTCRRASASGG